MSVVEECSLSEIFRDQNDKSRHGAHCMIWAPWNGHALGKFPTKAAILMQLRFDGSFGFPGGRINGVVNDHHTIVDGLNRELAEEVNMHDQKYKLTTDDYLFSHRTPDNCYFFHFYALRVDISDILAIEQGALTAEDYGDEAFGLVRVPLYIMDNGVYGLPTFLKNAFICNAKEQLLRAIKQKGILTEDEIQSAVTASQ